MEKKVEFKSIKDRINFFSGQNNSIKQNVDNKNPAQTKLSKPKVEKKNTDNTNSNKTKADNKNNQNIKKIEKTKIIGNTLFEEKENIYKYHYSFATSIAKTAKKILFLGNAQESFINTFVNIYRNIEFKDKFRHKIIFDKTKKTNYDISSFDDTENIRITSIPFGEEINENYKKFFSDISKMKIHLVCYTFNKNISDINPQQEKEIEFIKYLLSFLDSRDKLIFLCDSNEELNNEEINKFINKFNIEENDDLYKEGKSYSNKIFFINNKIIYDTNINDDNQKEWEKVNNKINDIREIIKKEEIRESRNGDFFQILQDDSSTTIKNYFNDLNKLDKYYFLYFLGEIRIKDDRIDILIMLINIMISMLEAKNKLINIKNNEIDFIGNKNYRNIIRTLSIIPFNNLKNIIFKNCELYDANVTPLNNLITSNLEKLDLSYNHLNKLELIFNENIDNLKNLDLSSFIDSKFNDKFINLKKINLAHNNISNVTCLSKSKLPNLVELDLSFNKIENIDFLVLNTDLNSLENKDLSDDQIIQSAKINFKNLKYLYLSNNHITDGIINFTKSICNLSHKLYIEKLTDNSYKFEYEENLIIKFDFFLKDNIDIAQFLKEISFSGLNYLKLKGFNDTDIKFLSNDTLKDLKELDIKENSLTIISIFDKISFPNIDKIVVGEEDFNDNSLENLLKNFPSIKVKSININLKRINIKYNNPELEINCKNFDILCDNMGEVDKIYMTDFPKDSKIFSYEFLIDKKIPIFNNIKVDNLKINYENKKYSCEIIFKLRDIRFKVIYSLDNLYFMKSDELLSQITSINFSNVIIDHNINLTYKYLYNIVLNNCIIENEDIFEQIKNIIKNNYNLTITSQNTVFKFKNTMNKDICKIKEGKLAKDDNRFYYIYPFEFIIEINNENRYDVIKNSNLNNISELDFSCAGLNNLDFLKDYTLVNLNKLSLNNNNIEDISIFDDDIIHFHKLHYLDLRDNPIKKGLEVLKKNFFSRCSAIRLDLSLNESKVLIKHLEYPFTYFMNIYVNDFNEISDYFNKFNIKPFDNSSSEVVYKIKEIFGLLPIEDKDTRPIIIDTGTCLCKAGMSGEEGPRTVFPSLVGYPKQDNIYNNNRREIFFGDDAEKKSCVLNLNYPIKKGLINNWDDVENIWGHIFKDELRVAPEQHIIMLIEPPYNSKFNREKMAQIMFETFNVDGLYIANSAVLSLYSIGKYNGIVIDSGEDITHFVPIYNSSCISHAYFYENLGGRDLTLYMEEFLNEAGHKSSTFSGKKNVKLIKEKVCYVAPDFDEELKCVEPYDYELPDGTHVIIKDQRIRCPETLFKPYMLGKEGDGIAKVCFDSIQRCDADIRNDLYNNILLSGGNSMFAGLPERLEKEIRVLAPDSMKEEVKVIVSPERKFATWIGGSKLSSISNFESCCITRTEYEECGAFIVHKKFP